MSFVTKILTRVVERKLYKIKYLIWIIAVSATSQKGDFVFIKHHTQNIRGKCTHACYTYTLHTHTALKGKCVICTDTHLKNNVISFVITVWRRKVFAAAAAAAIYSKNSEILAHSAVHYIINGN